MADQKTKELKADSPYRLEQALRWADRGFEVFPITPNAKSPPLVKWRTEKTTDEAQIRTWFEQYPNCNFGICPGRGYAVVDLDVKDEADGVEMFGLMEIVCGIVDTFTVSTPSGGHHRYYRVENATGNANSFPDGIDVRGQGGYVLGPGCVVDGTPYTVENDVPIAEAPAWMLDYFKPVTERQPKCIEPLVELDRPQNVEKSKQYLLNTAPAIEGENGDDRTYEVATQVFDFGVSPDKCMALMAEHFNPRCEPLWTEAELETKIENAWRYRTRRPGVRACWLTEYEERQGSPAGELLDVIPSTDNASDTFPVILAGDLHKLPDPSYLIDKILPEASVGMTYGPSGSLKTFMALDIALHGAYGSHYAESKDRRIEGFEIEKPIRTLFIAGEGARGLKKRVQAWTQRHGLEAAPPIAILSQMPMLAQPGQVEKLVRTIHAIGQDGHGPINYVVIDTAMRAATGLNLSQPSESQILIDACEYIKRKTGATVELIHHTGKDEDRGALGAANLVAGVDYVRRVKKAGKSAGIQTVNVHFEKMKDDECPAPYGLIGTPENLGMDAKGKSITSLVMERTHYVAKTDEGDDAPRLETADVAVQVIDEGNGKPIKMAVLADAVARRDMDPNATDGQIHEAVANYREYIRQAIKRHPELAARAHKDGPHKTAQWVFKKPA